MTCEEARKVMWREPFKPFRIRLKDGRTFDVRQPNTSMAAEAILIIGIPPAGEPDAPYSDRQVWVQWADVDTIEPLASAAPALPPSSTESAPSRRNGMTVEKARERLWREPFEPVRIRLTDGRTFDIRFRNLTMAAEAVLIIGIPPRDKPDAWYYERKLWVPWSNVEAIEPLTMYL